MEEKRSGKSRTPFISVYFRCCNVYQRICRHSDGSKYSGFCPKCLRCVRVPIGSGGTSQRVFEAE